MAKDRFVEVYDQGAINVRKIIVDRETGVNYLLASTNKTSGVGMSVLVDAEGKPVVTPRRQAQLLKGVPRRVWGTPSKPS